MVFYDEVNIFNYSDETNMNKDYWMGVVEKLNNEKTLIWASDILSCGSNGDYLLEETNLGEAIKYVPLEMIIQNTINAYKNEYCQPYCDIILMRIGKTTIPYLIKNISSDNLRIRECILAIVYDLDEIVGNKLAINMKQKGKSEIVLKIIEWIITNTTNKK